MKLKYLILLLILAACSPKKQDGWKLANQFVDKHALSFIANNDLLRFNYNPRTKFVYYEGLECLYRVFVKNDSSISIFTDNKLAVLIEQFGLELNEPIDYKVQNVEIIYTKGQGKLIVNDSIQHHIMAHKRNPVVQLVEMKKQITQNKIIAIRNLGIAGIVEVYLTADEYLLYFPSNPTIEEPKFQEFWNNQINSGTPINSNWYYYKAARPLDFG